MVASGKYHQSRVFENMWAWEDLANTAWCYAALEIQDAPLIYAIAYRALTVYSAETKMEVPQGVGSRYFQELCGVQPFY